MRKTCISLLLLAADSAVSQNLGRNGPVRPLVTDHGVPWIAIVVFFALAGLGGLTWFVRRSRA